MTKPGHEKEASLKSVINLTKSLTRGVKSKMKSNSQIGSYIRKKIPQAIERVREKIPGQKKPFGKMVEKGLGTGPGDPSARKVWAGLKRHSEEGLGGVDSLFTWPFVAAAEKGFGKKKVRNALWKTVGAPAMKADILAGRLGQKIPGMKGLFTENVKIPTGRQGHYREISRASGLAPLTKSYGLAAPIVVGVAAEKALRQLKGKDQKSLGDKMGKNASASDKIDRNEVLQKAASTMVNLYEENKGHKKRAQAIRILYKKAEVGQEEFPRSFSELEEKVASLLHEDLIVLERALELIGGNEKLGEIGSQADPKGFRTSSEKFQADILGYDDF